MTAWERAVEAMTTLWPKGNPSQIEATALLTAALPALERHFREKLAEELRIKGVPPGPTDFERGWNAAADHLVRVK